MRQTFKRLQASAPSRGCYVQDGKIAAQLQQVRVVRDGIVIFEGELASLQAASRTTLRKSPPATSAACRLEKFNDIKEGDVIECFVNEQL